MKNKEELRHEISSNLEETRRSLDFLILYIDRYVSTSKSKYYSEKISDIKRRALRVSSDVESVDKAWREIEKQNGGGNK